MLQTQFLPAQGPHSEFAHTGLKLFDGTLEFIGGET